MLDEIIYIINTILYFVIICRFEEWKITYQWIAYLYDVHIDNLVQNFNNSIANTLELLQSCSKSSIWFGNMNRQLSELDLCWWIKDKYKIWNRPKIGILSCLYSGTQSHIKAALKGPHDSFCDCLSMAKVNATKACILYSIHIYCTYAVYIYCTYALSHISSTFVHIMTTTLTSSMAVKLHEEGLDYFQITVSSSNIK